MSAPSLTPFLVSNGTGAAIIIAPGGGYHDLAWGKEGLDMAGMSAPLPPPPTSPSFCRLGGLAL